MKPEQLPPNLSIEHLQERLKNLITIHKKLKTNPPAQIQGRLRISQKGKYTEYYQIKNSGDTHGKYLPQRQEATARQLAQKDYDSKIISLVETEIKTLQKYLNTTSKIQDFYKQLCPARKNLITPLTLSDEQYATQWKNVTWEGLPFTPDTTIYTTIQGERVRSKSEVFIANALIQHKIPYRYEYPLILRRNQTQNITLHPDFLCLNLKTRNEFFWEHFGLMDSPDYVHNAVSKLNLYAQNKIIPGKKLIITMETAADPLTPSIIDQMIEKFLK